MAKTYDYLYSTGPNSVGSGTWVIQSIDNPKKNRGLITRIREEPNGISPSQLAGLYQISDDYFPGTAIPLNYTQVKQLSDTLALVVSHYGSSSGKNGFKRMLSRQPNGYRSIPSWPADSADLKDYSLEGKHHYTNGKLDPDRTIYAPLKVIRWSDTVFQDIKPADNETLQGKYNSNTYYIRGYKHDPYTLRFEGTSIVYDKWGGYDRWTIQHAATYDPLYKWRIDEVKPDDPKDPEIVKEWIRPNSEGKPIYSSREVAIFPTLK